MKTSKKLLLGAMFVSVGALSSGAVASEYFYQPGEGDAAVEVGLRYSDSTDSALNAESITPKLSAFYGITENIAFRLGTSYSFTDVQDGMNDFDFDVIAHREMGALTLHYGFFGALTPSKTGGENFSASHTFTPYIGVSMGDSLKYGIKLAYNTIATTSPVLGDNYTVSIFGEMDKEENYLLGASVDYAQLSGFDDLVNLNIYSRLYFSSFTLLPRVNYLHSLDDAVDASFGVDVSARFMF